MSDGRYFSTTKKGEIHELKEELRALDKNKRKAAVKKVIAAMTVGKDVSMLFPDVVNCMQTDDLELKKLVYLYLINYAKTQPDLAIMGVNTFVKDTQDPNPLIRSLAVRTMGCIRVDKITEYLCDPLQRCLKDDDPYVRKTAAICVAKLFDINAELVHDRGFLDTLLELLGDSNPMVVANALAALTEIKDTSTQTVVQYTPQLLFKLLRALNECTEWGQVFILDALASYQTDSPKDADAIIERVTPRLQHANSAVVLSAVKVIFQQLQRTGRDPADKALLKKMTPSLVTLLAAEPEIQYVALRNINIIVEKHPGLLSHEVKVFFCKYNDPSFVKLEKLEIMIKLASPANIDQVLMEFKEYASEVDVDFVRKAVRAVGRCAVTLETAAEQCINVLVDLIKGRVSYVVQEAVVVIKDIFRRYPNRYEGIISLLCENLDTLDEPEAKASMIWIIGEYADRIDNADELLEQFLDNFPEETNIVQLQLVTAAVKLFLKKPTGKPQAMIQLVLTYATQATDNPDLRDRAYIYWRLLSTDPEAARSMVLASKPNIADTSSSLEPGLLDMLFANLSMLSAVYHKPLEAFVSTARVAVMQVDTIDSQPPALEHSEDLSTTESAGISAQELQVAGPSSAAGDLLDLGGFDSDQQSSGQAGAPPQPFKSQLQIVVTEDAGKGLAISCRWQTSEAGPILDITADNASGQVLTNFMVQFNKNAFGLAPAHQTVALGSVQPGSSATAGISIALNESLLHPSAPPFKLQVALKNDQLGVVYFEVDVPLQALVKHLGDLEAAQLFAAWGALPHTAMVTSESGSSSAEMQDRMEKNPIFTLLPASQQTSSTALCFASQAQILPEPAVLLGRIDEEANLEVQCSNNLILAAALKELNKIQGPLDE